MKNEKGQFCDLEDIEESVPSEGTVPSRQALCKEVVVWMEGQQEEAAKDETVAPGSWYRPLANSQKTLGVI